MILGHQKQWQFLKKSVELGKISHAYLFCGEENLGKKTIAKEFIKLLECQSKNTEKSSTELRSGAGLVPHRNKVSGAGPCGKCFSCLQIQKGFHPDLTIVEPIENEIKIPQIRELSRILSLKPYNAPYKTAIIDGAEKMNQEAANALLKTLEEPSGQAILILISKHPEILPPTIVSRTQIIKFFPVPKNELEDYLKNQNLTEREIQELIILSEGKPAKLISFLSHPQQIEEEKNRLKEITHLGQSDLLSRFNYVKKITENNENLNTILESWLRYFRGLLLTSLKPEEKLQTKNYSISKLEKIIKTIESINFLISSTNVNQKLALEMIMLEL